jgi:hypothetical protein
LFASHSIFEIRFDTSSKNWRSTNIQKMWAAHFERLNLCGCHTWGSSAMRILVNVSSPGLESSRAKFEKFAITNEDCAHFAPELKAGLTLCAVLVPNAAHAAEPSPWKRCFRSRDEFEVCVIHACGNESKPSLQQKADCSQILSAGSEIQIWAASLQNEVRIRIQGEKLALGWHDRQKFQRLSAGQTIQKRLQRTCEKRHGQLWSVKQGIRHVH